MKRLLQFVFALAAMFLSLPTMAQMPAVDENTVTVKWSASAEQIDGDLYRLTIRGDIAEGWHTYPLTNMFSPTEVTFADAEGYTLAGEMKETAPTRDYDGDAVYFDRIVLTQDLRVAAATAHVKGEVMWIACIEGACHSPEYWEFDVAVEHKGAAAVVAPTQNDDAAAASEGAAGDNETDNAAETDSAGETAAAESAEPQTDGESDAGAPFGWGLIIEAILWGFAALLTPCVFPMVPMTVSFFIKGSSTPAAGRFKALMYGLFIILLYIVPIAVIILITRFVGGDAVTADIFNWLATHWFPNILFFIVFMIFAASFFGAFEITLPSKLVNKSDQGADKGGLLGIFFMALTLVLVSFSCTGPIVGTVLIKSTSGEFWSPIITMAAFATAFALPFTLLAWFPSVLKTMPKNGGWLNSVKVVLGFIEVALGFKFLSVADQTYHWHLLDREVYLAIWIVVFSLLGLYLLGKIRFAHDSKVEYLSVKRLALAIVVFSFVVYLIPGMFGAPLKALSGYMPPMQSQDFVLGTEKSQNKAVKYGDELHLPLGLTGYFDLQEGLDEGKRTGKPLFVDITGHGCVNCREMEQRVWSDPRVLEILRRDYIIVALYVDDKMSLDKADYLTTADGKVLKELGRKNSYIVQSRFGVNAQPAYVLLSPDDELLAPVRGYNLDVDGFVEFLKSGL
ncbi:MAG: thioredoxin family protein [Alistipes sp.]|nr:thioredoxin family protein [Alistipes sp.]